MNTRNKTNLRDVIHSALRSTRMGKLLVLAGCLSFAGIGQPISAMELPSGVSAELHEVLIDNVGGEEWLRFRFLAPKIARDAEQAPAFADLEQDFPHLCGKLAVPYISEYGLAPDKIVISLSDRIVKFGLSNPDATQYFEQFRVESGDCIWEGF